jgi:two-component system, sensor histidine kinase
LRTERILNVDDTEASRYVKTRILGHAGFEVLEAATGADALRMVAEHAPDLVLLDVKLPDIGGREVCARIKAQPSTARIVVLQTSASHVDLRNRVDSLDAGADGYLVEPMEPEELVANVRALLRMRRAERDLEQALEALREADRRKDEFLAMLAHELRNPLAPIRNAVEILRLTEDPATVARARELIDRQATHITRLVDDLLEVSRITQGKVVLRRKTVSLAALVETAVEAIRPTVEQNGQRLEVRLPEDTWLEADAVRMSQVLGNLLHNASKFTPRGGRIAVEASRGAEGLEIAVVDDGMGIDPSQLRSVFELFSQGDRSLDRAQGGLGIGLSLVKRLVEMHGGTATAHSEGPGKGSRMVLRLPASILRPAPDAAHAATAPRAEHGARRVLVVEDNPDAAEALVLLLRELGHEVAAVGDGGAAIEAARSMRPEVVLVDIGLPGMDGYALARELRKSPEIASARIVAVTGYGQPGDRERSTAAGIDAHLVKPVDAASLAQALAGAPEVTSADTDSARPTVAS